MITSLNTSRKQVAAAIKSYPSEELLDKRILNFGSGKYPELTIDYLLEKNLRSSYLTTHMQSIITTSMTQN